MDGVSIKHALIEPKESTEGRSYTIFNDFAGQVNLINDLIISDLVYGNDITNESQTFNRHLMITKYWFVRTSWKNKRRFIIALLNDLRSAWALSLLLKSIWNCRPKDSVVSISETEYLTNYDRVPFDHNRTAQPLATLAQVMSNERKWFHNLAPEKQAFVIAELLTICGGPLMWDVLKRATDIYENYRNHQMRKLLKCVVVQNPTVVRDVGVETTRGSNVSFVSASSGISSQRSARSKPSRSSSKFSATPVSAQSKLEASLQRWHATIKSIRDSQKLEEIEMTFADGVKKMIWKVNRPHPQDTETVDFMLPTSVAKRIFLMLPDVDKYATVNKYWAFMIKEAKEEQAARILLKNTFLNMEALVLQHDISMELLLPARLSSQQTVAASSIAASLAVSTRVKAQKSSVRASEKSTGAASFKRMLHENQTHRYQPIRKLEDLSLRLKQRGAADTHLFTWCQDVVHQVKDIDEKLVHHHLLEGVLRIEEQHFPTPLLRHLIDVPLSVPVSKDPTVSTSAHVKRRVQSATIFNVVLPSEQLRERRFRLWSRDFSGLYKVVKVASYQSPV